MSKKSAVAEAQDLVESPESVEENDTTEEIRSAFSVALDENKEEDDVKMAMIGSGATFKNVSRLYNTFMIEAGLAISPADRKAIVSDTLTGRDLSTEEGFDEAVTALTAAVTGATDRSSAALARSFAKANEVDVFVKPKSEGSSRNPFVSLFHAALIENPRMEEQGLKDIIASLDPDHQTNPLRWFSQSNNIRKMANSIAEKLS